MKTKSLSGIILDNTTFVCLTLQASATPALCFTDNMLKEKLRVKEHKSVTQENQTTQNRMTWKDKLVPDTNRI